MSDTAAFLQNSQCRSNVLNTLRSVILRIQDVTGPSFQLSQLRLLLTIMDEGIISYPDISFKTGLPASTISRNVKYLSNLKLRLVDLLAEPNDIPILAPVIQREIMYRLLVGDQGARLRQIASVGSQSQQVARAIDWLKGNFMRPLRIDDLASQVNMSSSTLHHHFRTLTAMSPLQYQKWLRLNEARRLMLTEHTDAATAAFNVGYESPSQFSREYTRLFGAPPLRDIKSLRQSTPAAASA